MREARTDAQGRFEFDSLPAGDYVFEARLPGFMTFRGTATVTASGVRRDLELQIGSIQETMVISGRPQSATGAASPAAAPRTISPRPPCTAGETGGRIAPPRKLRDLKPGYPGQLVAQGIAGPVEIEGSVAADGRVTDVHVISSPHPDLARAVTDAIAGWLFEPTLLNCEPVAVKIRVTATFELN